MRKFIYLLSSFLALTFAFAQSSHAVYDPNARQSKWFHDSIVNDPTVKSSFDVKAQKTYPVSTLDQNGKPIKQIRTAKATIKLGASASNVGKSLIKRVPVSVITQALIVLGLAAADWVLDPANNSVIYTVPVPDDPNDLTRSSIIYAPSSWGSTVWYATPSAACNGSLKDLQAGTTYYDSSTVWTDGTICRFNVNGNTSDHNYQLQQKSNPNYNPNAPTTEQKSIPIDNVATQVIADADAGDAAAIEVMNNAALDTLEAGLIDAQLDAASDIPQPDAEEITQEQFDNPDYPVAGIGAGTTTPTDTTTTPDAEAKPFELPPFCTWATKVCDFIDWVKTEPPEPPESGDVDVQLPDADMHVPILERLYVDMPAQCPADPVLEFMGARIPFPMSVFCQFAAMMKPLILLFAYIKGLSIIGTGLS